MPIQAYSEAGGRWSIPRPGRFTPEKDTVPTVQEAMWAPGAGLDFTESLSIPGFDTKTVQSVASRSAYTV